MLPDSQSRANRDELESLRAEVQNQRQTIALLVSEKMSLSTSLGRLSDVSSSTFDHSPNLTRPIKFVVDHRGWRIGSSPPRRTGRCENLSRADAATGE
jgi:hypothetical protein